jgi:hypothetical protein
MKRFIFCFLLISASLFASVDYSTLSTQELLAMMGYVPAKNLQSFKQELNQRLNSMNKQEKKIYKQNLRKMKK